MGTEQETGSELAIEIIIGGKAVTGRLETLSAERATIEAPGYTASVGDLVLLKIIGFTSLVGSVSSQLGAMIGFEFKLPLHPSVIEYLGFDTGAGDLQVA